MDHCLSLSFFTQILLRNWEPFMTIGPGLHLPRNLDLEPSRSIHLKFCLSALPSLLLSVIGGNPE